MDLFPAKKKYHLVFIQISLSHFRQCNNWVQNFSFSDKDYPLWLMSLGSNEKSHEVISSLPKVLEFLTQLWWEKLMCGIFLLKWQLSFTTWKWQTLLAEGQWRRTAPKGRACTGRESDLYLVGAPLCNSQQALWAICTLMYKSHALEAQRKILIPGESRSFSSEPMLFHMQHCLRQALKMSPLQPMQNKSGGI